MSFRSKSPRNSPIGYVLSDEGKNSTTARGEFLFPWNSHFYKSFNDIDWAGLLDAVFVESSVVGSENCRLENNTPPPPPTPASRSAFSHDDVPYAIAIETEITLSSKIMIRSIDGFRFIFFLLFPGKRSAPRNKSSPQHDLHTHWQCPVLVDGSSQRWCDRHRFRFDPITGIPNARSKAGAHGAGLDTGKEAYGL